MKAFTLKLHENMTELHLFEGDLNLDDDSCISKPRSICQKMTASQGLENVFTGQDEQSARVKSARRGRAVCGVCISHLYTSYAVESLISSARNHK